VPIRSPFPKASHLVHTLNPTFRKHQKHIQNYLTKRIEESRANANLLGAEAAIDVASHALDMITGRELRGEGDRMPDDELKSELFQCECWPS
jgi:hypothetical protein